jgi:two-component system chemotaxis sensor kinase CheA
MEVDASNAARVLELVFAPDLSTSERVTDLSGRGVGLDAAKRAVERIGGTIRVESQMGRGTEFRIRVPLTLAIQRTLVVRRGSEAFAIPITSVLASIRVSPRQLALPGGDVFLPWRGALVPLWDLGLCLAIPGTEAPAALCVVVEGAGRPCGLLVDEVLRQEEVVLKELDATVGRPPGLAGATVLADGQVAIVLDPRGLVGARAGVADAARADAERQKLS